MDQYENWSERRAKTEVAQHFEENKTKKNITGAD